MKTRAYAAQSATAPLGPFVLDRREPGATDVALEILYCGVCHSDMHSVRGEWPGIPFHVADIEMITMQSVEKAYARMAKCGVKYRFVIDIASLES